MVPRAVRQRGSNGKSLTNRQAECLVLAAMGNTDAQIARTLDISVRTVQEHIQNAKEHYGARTRIELGVRVFIASDLPLSQIAK